MKKFFVLLILLAWALPAQAFLETGLKEVQAGSVAVVTTAWPVSSISAPGPQNGDLAILYIERATSATLDNPITFTGTNVGTWTEQTCAGGSANMPLTFNGTANSLRVFTSTYASSGTGSGPPVINFSGGAHNSFYSILTMANSTGSIVNCWAANTASSVTASTGTVTSIPVNNELVFAYFYLTSGLTLSSSNTFTTLDKNAATQTTTQDPTAPLGTFNASSPTMFILDANLGPNGATNPAKAFTTTASGAAVNAAIAIQLAPAPFDPRPYPSGSRRLNTSGLTYFSQIDSAAIPVNWKQPFVDIIATYRSWLSIELSCDSFDWDKTDNDILNARTWGKRLQLGINSMGTTPPTSTSWLYASTACTNSGVVAFAANLWNQSFGPAKCTAIQTAMVDNANYQAAANDFQAKYFARYGALAGTGKPIVRVAGIGYAGLGTIELSLNNQCEGSVLTGTGCGAGTPQSLYWTGATNSYTADGWATTTASTIATTAQAGFENTALTDWGVPIVNETTDTPNLPNSGSSLTGAVCITPVPNKFNNVLIANDITSRPGEQVAEESGALGCSGTGVGSCFYANDYFGPSGANIIHSTNSRIVDLNYQYVTAQSAVSCIGTSGTILYTPSTSDCNVPALKLAESVGANKVEIYPADSTTALDYPWFQEFSDYTNNRNESFF